MATVARTKQDVDNMTRQERLWDSLNHAYGQQREASDRSFDRAYSQADRQALGRGMQRSSYNAQNLAGITNQKIKAQNDIWNNQIADYENRLGALEQQDAEAERWERQFNASREDAQWNRDFQQKQFDAGREDVAWNRAFQQKQADTANQQWQLNFDASRADTAFNQGMQERQFAANQDQNAWQRGMTERQYADNRADTVWNQNFQQAQADRSADQWERQFAQGNDSADRQLAASYVSAIVAQGGTPSDELLARAGLSRADAEAMRKGGSGGGSGGSGGNGGNGNNPPTVGNPNGLFSDMPTLGDLAGNNGGIDGNAVLNWINKHPASTPESTSSIRVQSPNAYKDAFEGQIVDKIPFTGKIQSPDAYKDAFAEQLNAPPKSQTAEERFGSTTKRKKNYSNETWSAYH